MATAILISAPQKAARAQQNDQSPLKGLRWREIGPFRGGRVTAVAGVTSQPFVYYFGATGGGVWKTTDGGIKRFWVEPYVHAAYRQTQLSSVDLSE